MKRTRFSPAEIEQHLQNIYLFSDLGGPSSHYNAGSSSSSTGTSSDAVAQLGPVLRAINASEQQEAFLRHLREFVGGKEKEIEDVCKDNYQDFVTSTDKLLKIRQGTVSLKHRVNELNDDIEQKGGQLADKKKALFDTRRVGQNVDEAIDTLQSCLRVLDLMSKIHKQIAAGKYYPALSSLDDLQHNHLKPLSHLPFATHLLSTLPATRQHIKQVVLKGMKEWLFQAREASTTVGTLALQATEQRNRRWKARKAKDTDGALRLARVNGAVELSVSERHEYYNVLEMPVEETTPESSISASTSRIDFKPLYHCILIHTTLDAREELQISYAEDRKAQATLMLTKTNLSPLTPDGLAELLDEMTGFFIIESTVLKTTSGFRSEQQVDELWDGMLEMLISTLSDELGKTSEVDVYLEAKLKLVAFSQTMETYGFVVHALNQFLTSLFQRFCNVLEGKVGQDLEQIIGEGEEEHQSMIVYDVEDFEKVASVSWLPLEGPWSEANLKSQEFPLALPFSQTYPLCCIDIRNYVDQFYQFVESSGRPTHETDDTAKKILDRILTRRISHKIRSRLGHSSNMSQLSLTMVNLLFFETACCELELLLSSLKESRLGPSPTGSNSVTELDSVTSFRDTLEATSERMVQLISAKTDSFFELAEYEWTPAYVPSGQIEERPSSYLTEMVDYLKLVMDSMLLQLPDVLKNTVYRRALQHVADTMMSYLIDPDPSKMNDTGLSIFAVDVRFIVQHAASVFPDLSAESGDVFEELSQMVALLQDDDLTQFLDPDIRDLGFPRIQNTRMQYALVKLITYYNSVDQRSIDAQRRNDAEELLKTIAQT